jgi:hypothetical protein
MSPPTTAPNPSWRGRRYGGTMGQIQADVAQLVEHRHGKEEVSQGVFLANRHLARAIRDAGPDASLLLKELEPKDPLQKGIKWILLKAHIHL